jgi:hypothetical protein
MSWTVNFIHTPSPVTNTLDQIFDGLNTSFQQIFNDNSDFTGVPKQLNPVETPVDTIGNYITAAITLGQWYSLQKPGNYTGPGTSQSNPYEVPLSSQTKCDLLANLGNFADQESIIGAYHAKASFNPAVGNTYYNLNSDPKNGGIKWENEELVIYDVYNFEGIADFGSAPTLSDYGGRPIAFTRDAAKALIVAAATMPSATSIAIARQVMVAFGFNPNSGQFNDGTNVSQIEDTLPYTLYTKNQINVQVGNVANLYLKNRFTKEEICQCNRQLYISAVENGYIKDEEITGSCSDISNNTTCLDGTDLTVQVGQAQPAPFLGFSYYSPNVMELTGSSPSSWNYGANNNYPSPFTSYIQQTYNTANYLGPYAMFGGGIYGGGIAGRLRIIVGGVGNGEIGFVAQCWDVFDDGPNNVDSNGVQYPSKKEWWDTCEKKVIRVRNMLYSDRILTDVQVAVKSYSGPGDDDVWMPTYQTDTVPDSSVNLTTLIGLAALTSTFGLL